MKLKKEYEKMNDLIEQLKANEKPFGFMSQEMQIRMQYIPNKHLECLCIESTTTNPIWAKCESGDIDWNDGINVIATFRLVADYKEVEWFDKVFANTGDKSHDYMNNIIGVTAHCKCGNVFCDDVVHCKIIGKIESQEESEVVKCEVYEVESHLHFEREMRHALHQACDEPDFIGLKAGGHLWGMFKCKDTGIVHNWILEESLANYEVLTPTHILFKAVK